MSTTHGEYLWSLYRTNSADIARLQRRNVEIVKDLETWVAKEFNVNQVMMLNIGRCTKSVNEHHFVDPNSAWPFKCVYCNLNIESGEFIEP